MKNRPHSKSSILLFLILLAAFGCIPQTPIPVYITPTPMAITQSATAVPTLEPQSVVTSVPVITPSPVPPSATSAPVQGSVSPSPTFMGAIVGPEYTLQPTETPRPSETPTPGATDTTTPTWTPTVTGTVGPSATPYPKLNPDLIGIQVDANMGVEQWDVLMGHAETLGVGWLKVQANWSFLQPNGPNDFGQEFGLFQLHMQNAKKRGFKILVSVAKAPNWARPSNQSESGPPDDPQLLGNFITFLLGKVGDVIDAVEVWNEPNLIREWTGALPFSGAGYMRLFGPAYGAIRGYSPTMTIVTAGLAPTGDGPGSVDDRTYLQQMYDAGLRNYRDVVIGIHPYSWGNPPDVRCCNAVEGQSWDDDPHFFFANNIEDYRQIMVNNGHADLDMWATEFGWATWDQLPGQHPDGDDWMTYNTIWTQAHYTIQALEIAQRLDYLGPMFIWNLNFNNKITVENRREIAAYSILTPVIIPQERPLYWALHEVTKP